MGIFDNKEVVELQQNVKELNRLYKKIESSLLQTTSIITDLKTDFKESIKRSPEFEKEAKQASKKTSEYRNKALETYNDAQEIFSKLKDIDKESFGISKNLLDTNEDVNLRYKDISKEQHEIFILIESIALKIQNIEKNIDAFETIAENHPNLEEEISELETRISNISLNESKSSQLVKTITIKRNELQSFYNELLGYTIRNEDTGEDTFVNGLKQDLENSFEGMESKYTSLLNNFNALENKTVDKFKKQEEETAKNLNNLLEINSNKISVQIKNWDEKYKVLNSKIEGLLPNALTAGLSHAFASKNKTETESYEKHKKQFNWGIIGMIAVSIIPFIISIISLLNDEKIDVIINRAPKVVIAILPLYVPVLWLSISSSKKMNLSKRLIEEYSHKEVLSKTFEGLSRQIKEVENDSISKELKIKLLQDFMEMYSENPGKLISDYNSSDHPVLELLEKSDNLEKAISRAKKIPGLGKVEKLLQNKLDNKNIEINSVADNLTSTISAVNNLKGNEENEETEVS